MKTATNVQVGQQRDGRIGVQGTVRRVLERHFVVGISGLGLLFSLDRLRIAFGWGTGPYLIPYVLLYGMFPAFVFSSILLSPGFTRKRRFLLCVSLSTVSWLIWSGLEIIIWVNMYDG